MPSSQHSGEREDAAAAAGAAAASPSGPRLKQINSELMTDFQKQVRLSGPRLEQVNSELTELHRQMRLMRQKQHDLAGTHEQGHARRGTALLATGAAERVSIAAASLVKVKDTLRPYCMPSAAASCTTTDQDALHASANTCANKDLNLSPYDIYFNDSPMRTATLLLMSLAWQVLGFSMALGHDSDDALTARSIAGRVATCKAFACIEVVHLVLLVMIHRYAPLKWKRLIFILTSHMLWIVQFQVAALYIDPLPGRGPVHRSSVV